ncbi:MAG: hypothetical protein HOD92_03520, partial [Deltaproteobacteria bacterium]|nr:hypothetical protein [Deltaproteobacteria bacterium]
ILNWPITKSKDGKKGKNGWTKEKFLKELTDLLGTDLLEEHINLLWEVIYDSRDKKGGSSITTAALRSQTFASIGFERAKDKIISLMKNGNEIHFQDPFSKVMLNFWD